MRKLKISRIDLGLAFELGSYETTAYLDTETGTVIFVEDYIIDQLEELLVGEDSKDVEVAIQGSGAFRRFDDVEAIKDWHYWVGRGHTF